MKKTSYYLSAILIFGGAFVSLWVYQKYFRDDTSPPLLFRVERGRIEEVIRVRGGVVPEKEFELEFPFSGIVDKIFVKEGEEVQPGKELIKLETVDFELERARLEAVLTQQRANLEKLLAGATAEELRISETKVTNAQMAVGDAAKNLLDVAKDSYTKADDAVRNKASQLFYDPRSSDPQLKFLMSDAVLEQNVELGRYTSENILASWESLVNGLSISSDLDAAARAADQNLGQIKLFLDKVAFVVNGLTVDYQLSRSPFTNLTQTMIDAWKVDIASARTSVNGAITGLTSAKEKLENAKSNLALAEKELTFKSAAPRIEDVEIAGAQIDEIESQIAAINEKIRKAMLTAPTLARVVKIGLEEGELFKSGQSAISLSTPGYKIQADISELDIGRIKEGNAVSIKLDAFPEYVFSGKIISIDSREIIKDEDKFYRVNILTERPTVDIRSGMNADLSIFISAKDDVLKIPEFAAFKRGGKTYVLVLDDGYKEREILAGISDGEFIEIRSGLIEGETVVAAGE